MDYTKYLTKGLFYTLKSLLKDIEVNGMPEGVFLFITFSTDNDDISLPGFIKRKYTEEMTIMLENGEFENLKVFDNYFEVEVYFDDAKESIRVPYYYLVKVEDPKNNFVLDFIDRENYEVQDGNVIHLDFNGKDS